MSENNYNKADEILAEHAPTEDTKVDEIAEDMPIEGEVAEQIVKQINSDGDGHPPIPDELPLLPLRDTVIFPVLVAPIAVGRENSIKLVDEAVSRGDRIIGVVAMKDSSVENATAADIHPMGVAVVIRMMAKVPDGGIRMIVQGIARIQIQQVLEEEPYLRARVKVLETQTEIAEERQGRDRGPEARHRRPVRPHRRAVADHAGRTGRAVVVH